VIQDTNAFVPKLTADGSFTFFSTEFDETFHSCSGAKQEAEEKFVKACQLAEKATVLNSLKLLDICYGLGYNSAAALATIWSVNPKATVELIGLELDASVPYDAIAHQLLDRCKDPIPNLLRELAVTYQVDTSQLQAQLFIGDARKTIQRVCNSGFQADAIFLDPFSPPKCPQLWTVEFLEIVAQCLKPNGRLATYSCAASVRTALGLSGLIVGSSPSIGRRSPGTLASFTRCGLNPLSQQEQEHLQTRAAVPYRDPQLQDEPREIKQRRQAEQQNSILESTSDWKKRWLKNP
jgi:tRNA U34 5-methylaminomethyl-2-thiouridine-forming methyltransferase MnmC